MNKNVKAQPKIQVLKLLRVNSSIMSSNKVHLPDLQKYSAKYHMIITSTNILASTHRPGQQLQDMSHPARYLLDLWSEMLGCNNAACAASFDSFMYLIHITRTRVWRKTKNNLHN